MNNPGTALWLSKREFNLNRMYLTVVACLAMPASAIADSLYLNCHMTQGSGFNLAHVYKQAPKDLRKQFLDDAIELGIIGWFVEPPTTWEVDLSNNTIVSPEESHKMIHITSATNTKIEGHSESGAFFSLNRINARLDYRVHINDKALTAWRNAHGGTIPETPHYQFNCGTGLAESGAAR